MSQTPLQSWLAGPRDFAQGVQLYAQQPGARPALLALMERAGAGPFTTAQLVQEIERLAETEPGPRPAAQPGAVASLPATGHVASGPASPEQPAEVAALVAEKLHLFKESSNLHGTLRHLATDEERAAAARTILANFRRGDEIWDALKYHRQHGALPPAVEPAALPADLAEATRRRNTVRTYLSSKRGTPEKRAAWAAELAALERRLQP